MLRRRRHSLKLSAAHKGLTMLEIMIVIAILGLVMGLVVVPKVMGLFGQSKVKIAKIAVDQIATDYYPQWSLAHQGKDCPENVTEVLQQMGKTPEDAKDPWGTPYEMLCGAGNLPAGAKTGIAVMSYGADRQKGTPDDIKSWERAPED